MRNTPKRISAQRGNKENIYPLQSCCFWVCTCQLLSSVRLKKKECAVHLDSIPKVLGALEGIVCGADQEAQPCLGTFLYYISLTVKKKKKKLKSYHHVSQPKS